MAKSVPYAKMVTNQMIILKNAYVKSIIVYNVYKMMVLNVILVILTTFQILIINVNVGYKIANNVKKITEFNAKYAIKALC